MINTPKIFKATDISGNCVQYSKGDIVYKNREAYIASRNPDLCKSPEHKNSGWEPLSSERTGTTVTFLIQLPLHLELYKAMNGMIQMLEDYTNILKMVIRNNGYKYIDKPLFCDRV